MGASIRYHVHISSFPFGKHHTGANSSCRDIWGLVGCLEVMGMRLFQQLPPPQQAPVHLYKCFAEAD